MTRRATILTDATPWGEPRDYPERIRTVRPAPLVLHRQVRRGDLALNQLRLQIIRRNRLIDQLCWAGMIGLGVVSAYLVVTM